MPSQYIFWPITLPEDNPNMQPKPDSSYNMISHPVPQPPPPRTRTRKSSKQATPKRPPQRGLGVAQLERLRMEQAGESEIVMQQPRRVVLPHTLVGSYVSQAGSTGGNVLPCPYPLGAMGPPGHMGRYLAPQALEPPSTQMVPRPVLSPLVEPVQCFYDQCEFCLRRKRLFGEGSLCDNMGAADHLEMDLTATMTPSADLEFMASMERRKVSPAERQTREYQFFPTCGGSLAEMTFPAMVDAAMSAPLTTEYPSQPIDLSLKLSF